MDSPVFQENIRASTNALVRFLRESSERPVYPLVEEYPLEHSGTHQEGMETLLVPTRATR